MRPSRGHAISVLAALGLALLLAAGADALIEWLRPPRGILFPPQHRATVHTSEYSFTTEVNRLGYRDDLPKPGAPIVVAIGDSFTYGWGVSGEQAWPNVLEATLTRAMGRAVEVANVGAPGMYPDRYATAAERALPRLRPQLVLVAVHQGDDFGEALLAERDAGERKPFSPRAVVRWAFPGLTSLIARREALFVSAEDVRGMWLRQVESVAADPQLGPRFAALPADVQRMYRSGNLNPGLLISLHMPDFFTISLDLESTVTRRLVDTAHRDFKRIRAAAAAVGARAVILSLPDPIYTRPHDLRRRQRLGFATTADMLTTDAPDEAIRRAAIAAGLPFVTITHDFRASVTEAFFPWDGHFNASGHQLYAELLTPAVAALLRSPAQ